ncbi:MAG: NAD(P)-dependent dehydrogenase (short-subunit alcohol dehydrogenase family) [Granulosicoccus sp.]|jgi:NAD(P)-dependent dehydrogenase (short-subunit alcohol dehydrogenase family)
MQNPRTIVITGCSKGLGRALLDEFINAGHTVAGCSRSSEQMMSLTERYGPKHYFKAVDVSGEHQVKAWSEELMAHMGVPDLVINNAAMINAPAALWEVPIDEFQQLVNINIVGVQCVIRCLLPPMIEQGRGVLVNLSSGWGRSVSAEVGPYCASKWAIEGLTKALAEELPAGLAAIPLSPGVIDTDMLRVAWGDDAAGFRTPQQWAVDAAPYILNLSEAHNGQSLTTPG